MSQFIIDQDTVSIKSKGLVNLFDYRVSNPFYLFAPVYYTNFYSMTIYSRAKCNTATSPDKTWI